MENNKVLIRITELFATAGITYYIAVEGANVDLGVFALLYSVIMLAFLIDWFVLGKESKKELEESKLEIENNYKKKIQELKINLLIEYFYQQNRFALEDDVSMVIHKKLDDKYYEQYTDYFPSGRKKEISEKKEIKKGIVYRAFKMQRGEFSESFKNDDEKREKLIHVYNFRSEEANEQIKHGEKSYYCKSITNDDGSVWGVLYLKSKGINTFPKEEELHNSEISKNSDLFIKLLENEIS